MRQKLFSERPCRVNKTLFCRNAHHVYFGKYPLIVAHYNLDVRFDARVKCINAIIYHISLLLILFINCDIHLEINESVIIAHLKINTFNGETQQNKVGYFFYSYIYFTYPSDTYLSSTFIILIYAVLLMHTSNLSTLNHLHNILLIHATLLIHKFYLSMIR